MMALQGLCIGVTGGIGSGKSSLARRLVQIAQGEGLHIRQFDFDAMRTSLLRETQSQSYSRLRQGLLKTFGTEVLGAGGEIHRLRLSEIVFKERQALDLYNAILTPILVDGLRSEICERDIALIEWPNLVAQGLVGLVSGNLIVVNCDLRERLARLKSSELSQSKIRKRIRYQRGIVGDSSLMEIWELYGGMVWNFHSDKDDLDRFCIKAAKRIAQRARQMKIGGARNVA